MGRLRTCLLRRERGMEIVEGMIVMTLMVFVLTMFLSFGFLLYQQLVVSSVANDTASRLAQSYAYPDSDPVMGFITRTMKCSVSPFRYLTGHLSDKNAEKGEKYARWSLEQISFANEVSPPDIEVRTLSDSFAQRHVEVEISATYEIPFGGALVYFGLPETVTYHAVGYGSCVDLSNYIHSVDTLNNLFTLVDSKAVSAIDSIFSAIHKMAGLFGS